MPMHMEMNHYIGFFNFKKEVFGKQYLIMARLIYLRTDTADPEARGAGARVGPSPGTNFIKIVVITTL